MDNHTLRPYGPSNWQERPQEGTILPYKRETAPGMNDGALAHAIVDARTLMKEQAMEAIEAGEESPDALWGLWDRIARSATEIYRGKPETKSALEPHRSTIESGLRRFKDVPREKALAIHPRLAGHVGHEQKTLISWLDRYSSDIPMDGSEAAHEWDTISLMLRAVAEFEDEQARSNAA